LLEPLAFGPAPALSGLDPELQTVAPGNFRRRDELHKKAAWSDRVGRGDPDWSRRLQPAQSDPSLVGGTELTNANLWRWDPSRRR